MSLPMNTGSEAVETALKLSRKWAYRVKKIPRYKAEIITANGNFHGRTITIISSSTETLYKEDFGPFTPGFISVPYGNTEAIKNAITPNTAAVMLEPVQGENGVIIPPEGYLREVSDICKQNNVLFIADEIQTGLGRTGKLFACDHEGVKPDIMVIGKAVSGGFYPVSFVLSSKDILGLFRAGEHGSTFGGNPLAAAVTRTALKVLIEEDLIGNSQRLGEYFIGKINQISSKHIKEVRGKGLLVGIELFPEAGGARRFCEKLKEKGILAKETHTNTIRFAPPLIITKDTLDWAIPIIESVLKWINKMPVSRKAKIVATIGPKTLEKNSIKELIQSGMNVARLNFSHGTYDEYKRIINIIRDTSKEIDVPVAILQDLRGPKLRVGKLPDNGIDLKKDQSVRIYEGKDLSTNRVLSRDMVSIPFDIQNLYGLLSIGANVFLDDGSLELEVTAKDSDSIIAKVIVGGTLKSHKGINLPNTSLDIPSFTEKDKTDLIFGLENDVDIIAISFVKTAKDIQQVKDFIKEYSNGEKELPIVSKLERSEAIANLEEIIKISDGVMVARGDLAVETSPAAVPVIQKKIIQDANKYSTFVITATQMLDSMIHNQRPTRAEASDVANAVFDGTDALMLSGETAVGDYPVLSISMMDKIIREAEKHFAEWGKMDNDTLGDVNDDAVSLTRAAGELAHDRNVAAIVVFTQTGRTALMMSKVRPRVPIYAFTPNINTFRKLNIFWGVYPCLIPFVDTVEKMVTKVNDVILSSKKLNIGEQVILVSGFPLGESRPPNFVFLYDLGKRL